MPSVAAQIAQRILERLRHTQPKRGVRRDRAALDLLIGCQYGLELAGDSRASAANFMAVMVATRGAAFLEECVERDGYNEAKNGSKK